MKSRNGYLKIFQTFRFDSRPALGRPRPTVTNIARGHMLQYEFRHFHPKWMEAKSYILEMILQYEFRLFRPKWMEVKSYILVDDIAV